MTITTTAKDFWDKYHCIDGGQGEHFEAIKNAMLDYGTEEMNPSEFVDNYTTRTYDRTLHEIIKKMREKGFEMVADPEFAAWCKHLDKICNSENVN